MPPFRTLSALTITLTLSLAAACGGKGPTAPRPAEGTPYAGVFVDRQGVAYRYTTTSSMFDPDDERADANGTVVDKVEVMLSCATVTRRVGTWQLAEIVCTGADDSGVVELLDATFAAAPAGLWRLAPDEQADPAGLAAVAARPPLLAAHPVPIDDKHEEEGGAFGELHKVHAVGAGWCVEDGSWGGDEGGDGICFDPARGVTKVTRYFAGGSTKDELIELVE